MATDETLRADLERDGCERLSADDLATQREAEFLSRALLQQRLRATGEPAAVQGECTNCGERCSPLTVYCDPECREDHEVRLQQLARRGRGL